MDSRLEQNTVSIEKCLQFVQDPKNHNVHIRGFFCFFFILMIYLGFLLGGGGGIGCSKGANSVQKQFLFHFNTGSLHFGLPKKHVQLKTTTYMYNRHQS